MLELFPKSIIDKDSKIPLYYQLYQHIEKLIDDEKLQNGDKMPTEDELVAHLGISRPTIRQAYKELSSKGYIHRERSKGTIVTKPKVFDKFLSELTSFRSELESRGSGVKTEVLAFEVLDNIAEINEVLECDTYIHIRRLRYSDSIPVVYLDSYIPYDSYKDMLNYDMEQESMYSIMNKLGRPIHSVKRSIGAILPSKEAAEKLKMKVKDPVLLTKTIGKDKDNKPVEYSIACYNAKVANFEINLELKDIIDS